jgi:hypothetical protein
MLSPGYGVAGRRQTLNEYPRHYEAEAEVDEHLRVVSGCRAHLLRYEDGREVMFTSITFFTSIGAVRGFPETTTSWPLSKTPPGRR